MAIGRDLAADYPSDSDLAAVEGWNMTTQISLFDAAESQRHAVEGITRAANNNAVLLHEARQIAKDLAQGGREISMDDVARVMGKRSALLGNAAGSVFSGREWEWTGKFIKSARVRSHSNLLRVWRLK